MEEVGIGAPRKDWMNGPFRGALFMRPGAVLDRTLAVLPHLSISCNQVSRKEVRVTGHLVNGVIRSGEVFS